MSRQQTAFSETRRVQIDDLTIFVSISLSLTNGGNRSCVQLEVFFDNKMTKLVRAHTMGEVSHGKIGCGVTVECEPGEDRDGIGEMDS